MVRRLQVEASNAAELTPIRAAEIGVALTALYANVRDELRESEFAYKAVLLSHLESEEAANRAKIRAENSDAYRRWRTAKDAEATVIETIRTLKNYTRTAAEEMRLSR